MKRYEIKRTTPVTAIVIDRYPFGEETPVTEQMFFDRCKAWLRENQEELTVYKVGYQENRKNGIRHLYKKILAHDDREAGEIFKKLMASETPMDGRDYQLLTGDWKPVDIK